MTLITQPTNFRWVSSYTPPPLWTPANITTALWLDAADASTITTVSGAVSQWDDKSGNTRHATQSTAANRPVVATSVQNGLNAIRFDGTNDSMTVVSTFMQGQNNFSISWVSTHRGAGTGDGYRPDITTYSSAGFDAGSYHYVKTSNLGAAYPHNRSTGGSTGYWGNYDLVSGTSYANGTFNVLQFRAASTGWSVLRNGSTEGSVTATLGTAFVNDGLVIAAQGLPARFSQLDVLEIVVAIGSGPTAENQRIEGYLAHKWGLASSLPAGHPYKSAPPYYRW